MNDWFALATRGLEFVSEREIRLLPEAENLERAYRRILFEYGGPPAALLQLRSVDDVFVHVATWQGIGRPRSSLEQIRRLGSLLGLDAAAAACARVRHIPSRPAFSVTASFVGKRNYSTDEIKLALADGISAEHGWRYTGDDASANINVRLFMEHETAILGLRLGQAALHERPYKHSHAPGSLKPSVAAALLLLAQVGPSTRVVDPCCGVGTIPIEAALAGAVVQAGDWDAAAVAAARANVSAAGVQARIEQWDAQALPLPHASVDCVVSNLPWGRQIAVDSDLEIFYTRVLTEIRRIVVPGGRVVVLASIPEWVTSPAFVVEQTIEISLFGQTPSVILLRPV